MIASRAAQQVLSCSYFWRITNCCCRKGMTEESDFCTTVVKRKALQLHSNARSHRGKAGREAWKDPARINRSNNDLNQLICSPVMLETEIWLKISQQPSLTDFQQGNSPPWKWIEDKSSHLLMHFRYIGPIFSMFFTQEGRREGNMSESVCTKRDLTKQIQKKE